MYYGRQREQSILSAHVFVCYCLLFYYSQKSIPLKKLSNNSLSGWSPDYTSNCINSGVQGVILFLFHLLLINKLSLHCSDNRGWLTLTGRL